MIIKDIKEFHLGWFIGDFEPSILKTRAVEVAHHHYKEGDKSIPHYHKIATEYNYIVKGSLILNEHLVLKAGHIFVYEPNEISNVYFREDTDLIIIKLPSIVGDKYEV